jgi:hypothetical protein
MGHASIKTTERYAAYAPSAHENEMLRRAFAPEVTIEVAIGANLTGSEST